MWVALVPLLVWLARPRTSTLQAILGLGVVGAFYHLYLLTPFLSLAWWGWGTTTRQGLQAYFSYQTLFLGVTLSLIALWGGIVMALVGLLMRRHLGGSWLCLWWVPAVWVVGLEYAGHASVFGFSWGLLGNRLHQAMVLRQLASLTGVYGLSFLILLANTAIALVIGRLLLVVETASPRPSAKACVTALWRDRLVRRVCAIMGSVFIASFGYGLAAIQHSSAASATLRVALLQGGAKAPSPLTFSDEGLDRAAAKLLHQIADDPVDWIVLPETIWLKTLRLDGTATPWDRACVSPEAMHAILAPSLTHPNRVVVFGIDAVKQRRMYNATVFWTPQGLAGTYFKRRLVPFSEYAPALIGRFAPQNRLHGPRFSYSQGRGSQLVRINDHVIGSFICQEVLLPGLIRESVRDGAQLLVSAGNDRVFLSPIVASEHANLAKLRAVEHRRFLLRAMKGGVTAIIDPLGRELATAPLDAESAVRGTVELRSERTVYTRFGDWVVWCCGLVVLVGLFRPKTRGP